jgi:hypothetical protein
MLQAVRESSRVVMDQLINPIMTNKNVIRTFSQSALRIGNYLHNLP